MTNNVINFYAFKAKKQDEIFDNLFYSAVINIQLEKQYVDTVTIHPDIIKQVNQVDMNTIINNKLKHFNL